MTYINCILIVVMDFIISFIPQIAGISNYHLGIIIGSLLVPYFLVSLIKCSAFPDVLVNQKFKVSHIAGVISNNVLETSLKLIDPFTN